MGLLNLFVQHTSCALSLNENWDEDVRADMSDALDRIAPEDRKGNLYRHSAEGLDDMPVSYFWVVEVGEDKADDFRRISRVRWLERVLRFRFRMASWLRVLGRGSGIWSLGRVSIRGRLLLRFRGRRSDGLERLRSYDMGAFAGVGEFTGSSLWTCTL